MNPLIDLANELARLYPIEESRLTVMRAIGVDPAGVRQDGRPRDVWTEIVYTAYAHALIEALLHYAIREFPASDELARLRYIMLYPEEKKEQ